MCLIRGLGGLCPCTRCLIPKEQLSQYIIGDLRTAQHAVDVLAKAEAAETKVEKDEIVKEVNKLAESAVATDAIFESIRVRLLVVDGNNYQDENGQPIPKLTPTWVKYQQVHHHL